MEVTYAIRKLQTGYGFEIFENGVKTQRQEFEPNVPGRQAMSHAKAKAYAEALVAELQAAFAASQPEPEVVE